MIPYPRYCLTFLLPIIIIMILIMKILLHNVHKIIILRYPTYVYQFLIFLIITKIECWPLFKQDPMNRLCLRESFAFHATPSHHWLTSLFTGISWGHNMCFHCAFMFLGEIIILEKGQPKPWAFIKDFL